MGLGKACAISYWILKVIHTISTSNAVILTTLGGRLEMQLLQIPFVEGRLAVQTLLLSAISYWILKVIHMISTSNEVISTAFCGRKTSSWRFL